MTGGQPMRWTLDQLIALARFNVHDAIREGHEDYAKTATRELLRLCLQTKEAQP